MWCTIEMRNPKSPNAVRLTTFCEIFDECGLDGSVGCI